MHRETGQSVSTAFPNSRLYFIHSDDPKARTQLGFIVCYSTKCKIQPQK